MYMRRTSNNISSFQKQRRALVKRNNCLKHVETTNYTPWKFTSPRKRDYYFSLGNTSSNHPFSGSILVFRGKACLVLPLHINNMQLAIQPLHPIFMGRSAISARTRWLVSSWKWSGVRFFFDMIRFWLVVFHQPIWKKHANVKMGSSSPFFAGVKIKTFEVSPPIVFLYDLKWKNGIPTSRSFRNSCIFTKYEYLSGILLGGAFPTMFFWQTTWSPLGPKCSSKWSREAPINNLRFNGFSLGFVITPIWLVVSTHLKNISEIGSFPQVGMKIRHI